MIKEVTVFVLFVTILGCNPKESSTWEFVTIDNTLKNEIDKMDKQVVLSIVAKNPQNLKRILSVDYKKNIKDYDNFILTAGEFIHSVQYNTLDQYHIKNSSTNIVNKFSSDNKGDNTYVIYYKALNEEAFVSLITCKTGIDAFLIINIYGKYPDGWKLNIIQIKQYTINGMTAPELYRTAQTYFEKGNIMDAYNNMSFSESVASSENELWTYQMNDEIKSFYEKVKLRYQSDYHFPITIVDIFSKPKIIGITPVGNPEEGYFPMVEYVSSINLDNTYALKTENEQIQNLIGDLFLGLDKNNKLILYRAYNEIPDKNELGRYYGFTQEIKN